MNLEPTKNKYSPKTALARKMFSEIQELPEMDGVDGPSNEYYLRKIVEYLDYLETTGKPPTLAGLALFCGISRGAMYNYSKDEAYGPSLVRFRQIIEMTLEENWTEGDGGAPSIFLGKNLGYTDKQTVEVEHKLAGVSQKELDARLKRLEMIDSETSGPGHRYLGEQTSRSRVEFNEDAVDEAIYEVIEDGRD